MQTIIFLWAGRTIFSTLLTTIMFEKFTKNYRQQSYTQCDFGLDVAKEISMTKRKKNCIRTAIS